MAGYKGPRDINSPHISFKTGYAMKTLATIVKLESLKIGGHDMMKKMRCFFELYESDYLMLTIVTRNNIVWKYRPSNCDFFYPITLFLGPTRIYAHGLKSEFKLTGLK